MTDHRAACLAGANECEEYALRLVDYARQERRRMVEFGHLAITALATHRHGEVFAAFYDALRADCQRNTAQADADAREWLAFSDSYRACLQAEAA